MVEKNFLNTDRISPDVQAVPVRVQHFKEFISTLSDSQGITQACRCMDCGIPFCSNECPLHNLMPDFNAAVKVGNYAEAYKILSLTSPFPEITGRICPALCEEGCTLGLTHDPVGIKSIERKVADYAFAHGLAQVKVPSQRSGFNVAIVGSGPAGLACAQLLNQLGHYVTVYDKLDRPGGLLRYGIPDFKLSKEILDRRIKQLELEGVEFVMSTCVVGTQGDAAQGEQKAATGLEAGIHDFSTQTVSMQELQSEYDAVVLALGSEKPRDLPLPGRELKGIYFALDFLIAQNRENQGFSANPIDVQGKNVVVIGGGETASDCIGCAVRKGAKSVTQVDYHIELPEKVDLTQAWPHWRHIKRTSTSQQEGCTRLFATDTTAFIGEGHVQAITTQQVEWEGRKRIPVPGTEGRLDADVVLIAMGYAGPSANIAQGLNLKQDGRGNYVADLKGAKAYLTSKADGSCSCSSGCGCGEQAPATQNGKPAAAPVFAAGDCRRGQSLVVYALKEGRDCALAIDQYLSSLQ